MGKYKTINVFTEDSNINCKLGDHIKFLKDKYDSIPSEYAEYAFIEYNVCEDYDSFCVSCEVGYKRLETAEDRKERKLIKRKYDRKYLQNLIKEVDKLSKELGKGG